MKKLFKKMKNEKVAKGRIIGLAGPCSSLFHSSHLHSLIFVILVIFIAFILSF